MRTTHLDFLHPDRSWARIGVSLLLISAIVVVAVAWRHQSLITDRSEFKRVVDSKHVARRDLVQVREAAGDPKVIAQEVSRANAVLAKLAVPWDALFVELEASSDRNTVLLAVQPEASGKQVRLSGEARDFESLLQYVLRLEKTAELASVTLVSHEMRPDNAVAFTVVANWVARP